MKTMIDYVNVTSVSSKLIRNSIEKTKMNVNVKPESMKSHQSINNEMYKNRNR